MEPIHIRAKPGSVAERVLIAGDPKRVKKLSTLLTNPETVNENRGFLVVTGSYNGMRVSIATHGIGAPSAAIVVEELAMLGARTFVRYGTSGALSPNIQLGEFVIPTSASHIPGGLYKQYFGGRKGIKARPDKELAGRIRKTFRGRGLKFNTGKIFSSDAFYAEEQEFAKKYFAKGNIAVEMECAMLFKLSMMKGWRSAAALIISDSLAGGVKWLSPEAIDAKAMEGAAAVLDALTK